MAAVALLGASCGGDADENGESDEAAAEPAETTAAPDGVEFTSADKAFEVVFPEEPSEGTEQVPLPDGQTVEVPTQAASFSMSNFTTAAVEYPQNVPVSDDPDQALDDAVDGAVANVKGAELVNSDEVDVDGTPGRRIEIKVQQGNAFAQGVGGEWHYNKTLEALDAAFLERTGTHYCNAQ